MELLGGVLLAFFLVFLYNKVQASKAKRAEKAGENVGGKKSNKDLK